VPKKEAKPLHRSLTVQSGIGLSLLILARVLLPLVGWEVPDDLFQGLLALCLGAGSIGLRRALPVLALCCLPLGLVQCTHTCKKIDILVTDHPVLPSPPAAKVEVKCDGTTKATLLGADLKK
jgi:hypothetical protein